MTSVGAHFGMVDETTVRLVGRCERVGWLQGGDDDDDGGEGGQGKEKVAKKFLGVDMAARMASSLSVVEVTTQKERPGVLTGSRGREEMEKEEEEEKEEPESFGRGGDARDEDGAGGGSGNGNGLDVGEATLSQDKSPFEVEGEG